MFSKEGLSGEGTGRFAHREQIKVFQDRGIIIVVVSESDLQRVLGGKNFVHLLREKYEYVRLDVGFTAP
jgi:hypothetical protein